MFWFFFLGAIGLIFLNQTGLVWRVSNSVSNTDMNGLFDNTSPLDDEQNSIQVDSTLTLAGDIQFQSFQGNVYHFDSSVQFDDSNNRECLYD